MVTMPGGGSDRQACETTDGGIQGRKLDGVDPGVASRICVALGSFALATLTKGSIFIRAESMPTTTDFNRAHNMILTNPTRKIVSSIEI
ncbi:hypothetical protein [Burkholderia stabilis]|uniref:hypothetical protein n=1 Tax=Burkholderia stabilis TaxID=95485 RepID=UPI001592AA5D|nr:hypothetical protein [Burkholderia stabilis]